MHEVDPRFTRDKELTLQISQKLVETNSLSRCDARKPAAVDDCLLQLVFELDPTCVEFVDPLLRDF
jgi:hypothetical protein